jgi:cytochrome c
MSHDPIKRKHAQEAAQPGGYGDARRGEALFKKFCKQCHSVLAIDNTKSGPHLAGIIDRDTADVRGYPYSPSLKHFHSTWTVENLALFLESPKKMVPGNKMEFTGFSKDQDRYDLIEYLTTK